MSGLPKTVARVGVAPDINVTPLVDVVLVLLIIFMVVAPRLDQIELQLERAHRLEAQGLEARRDRAQHRPRIGERWPAVRLAQARQDLRAARPPGHRRKGRRIHPARPVGVALLPDQARRIDIGAGRIHAVERARQAQAAVEPAREARRRQPLAARDADQIRQDQIDRLGRRKALEEGPPG